MPAVAVIATLLLISASASAQDVSTYASIVDRYASGDQDGALTQLGGWPRAEVSAAVARAARTLASGQLRTAVMLHTDLGFSRIIEAQSSIAGFHIGTAARLLRAMHARDPSSRIFAGRWHAVVASIYTARGLAVAADRLIRDGLTDFPRTPELYVARGSIQEMRAAAMTYLRSSVTAGGV